MSTRIDTAQTDANGDGIIDVTTTNAFYFTGDKLDTNTVTTEWLDGTRHFERHDFAYDAAGREVLETRYYDNGSFGSGLPITIEKFWDANNRLEATVLKSPDFDGDGITGDYTTVERFTYDSAGRMTVRHQSNLVWGTQADSDYIHETWTYDKKSLLVAHGLDDPMMYDCEINKFYNYKDGKLQNIKEQNDIRFGDERPRIDESFTYNRDGSVKTHTDWADWSDNGWMQRVDTAYTWGKGYDAQKITYDRQGDFKPEAVKLVEHWYDRAGHLTHTLTSHDWDGKGGPLAGGFDSRDLVVQTWNGDLLTSITTDLGADGTIDSATYFSTWTDEALLA